MTPLRRRVQQCAFACLYRFGSRLYDPVTRLVFGPEWDRWRRIALTRVEGAPVLDLGCGTGELLRALAERGHASVGVDASPSMLAAARRRLPQGRLVRADAAALPFRTGSFGSVTATFPAPFILERGTLDEICRVLRPGGVFVVIISGEIERWEVWRFPLRAAMAAFYGRQARAESPVAGPLEHPNLAGHWEHVPTPRGRALVWIARRR